MHIDLHCICLLPAIPARVLWETSNTSFWLVNVEARLSSNTGSCITWQECVCLVDLSVPLYDGEYTIWIWPVKPEEWKRTHHKTTLVIYHRSEEHRRGETGLFPCPIFLFSTFIWSLLQYCMSFMVKSLFGFLFYIGVWYDCFVLFCYLLAQINTLNKS